MQSMFSAVMGAACLFAFAVSPAHAQTNCFEIVTVQVVGVPGSTNLAILVASKDGAVALEPVRTGPLSGPDIGGAINKAMDAVIAGRPPCK